MRLRDLIDRLQYCDRDAVVMVGEEYEFDIKINGAGFNQEIVLQCGPSANFEKVEKILEDVESAVSDITSARSDLRDIADQLEKLSKRACRE